MKEKKLFFKNSKGEKIVGLLSNTKSDTIVILCHGHWSNKDGLSVTSLVEELSKNRIATFRFDFSGSRESEGNMEELTISKESDEILNAIKLLNHKNIIVYGSSYGGGGAILSAINSKDIKVLLLKAPVFNWMEKKALQLGTEKLKQWKKEGKYTDEYGHTYGYALYEDAKKIDLPKNASKIKIPVMIGHGDKDEAVPLKSSKLFKKKVPQTKIQIIKGVGHRVRGKQLERLNKSFVEFIKENI